MDFAIAVLVAAALLAAAFAVLRESRAAIRRSGSRRSARPVAQGSGLRLGGTNPGGGRRETRAGACPICQSPLGPGERIKSDVSSATSSGGKDRLMRIFGCPHCWPPRAEMPRACPVCGRELVSEGYVMARYFERPDRKHVHVLGCLECRGGRR
ncbi:MAG TPA: hypothetical protein VMV90_12960 [Rectinemataceae bacterium]|nr:hypothetical protein [Rectinemataceae bacterium]